MIYHLKNLRKLLIISCILLCSTAHASSYYKHAQRCIASQKNQIITLPGIKQLLRKVRLAKVAIAQESYDINSVAAHITSLFLALDSLETLCHERAVQFGSLPGLYIASRNDISDLYELTDRLAQKLCVPTPTIVLAHSDQFLSAAAAGVQKECALLLIGTGLLSQLTDGQVESVLCHELAHIAQDHVANRVLYSLFLTIFLLFLLFLLFGWLCIRCRYVLPTIPAGIGFAVICFSAYVMVNNIDMISEPLLSRYSRSCEYQADKIASIYTGNLHDALARLARVQEDRDAQLQLEYKRIHGSIDHAFAGHEKVSSFMHRYVSSHQKAYLQRQKARQSEHPTFAQRQQALHTYIQH